MNILSIDLKSFFASCECIARNLDPFTTPLVVANPNQGGGAITLAVTPCLKKLGVPSRGRIFEIPKNIKYIIAPPRMNYYVYMSKKVISIYLDYVSCEDLHIYSIDECFLDVTHYLKLYKKTDYELAQDILKDIKTRTGLTATCGIGPNILMAKIAMDIEAKKNINGIAKWTKNDIKNKLWKITPLSKMWSIGPRMEKRLNKLGIKTIGDLALTDKYVLKNKFGVIGIELWEHANGIDKTKISELDKHPKEKSYSNSQILFKDYYGDNIKIIIEETADVVIKRIRQSNKQATIVGLAIGYSRSTGGGFYRTIKLLNPTDNENEIINTCYLLFDKYYSDKPIRKVGISLGGLVNKDTIQLDLFTNYNDIIKEDKKNIAIDNITNKYGKNSILRASSLLSDSTIRDRNKKRGGHNE